MPIVLPRLLWPRIGSLETVCFPAFALKAWFI